MADNLYPRAKVKMNTSGELLLSFMHKGMHLSFIFVGDERSDVYTALSAAVLNPGQEFTVEWDEKARS